MPMCTERLAHRVRFACTVTLAVRVATGSVAAAPAGMEASAATSPALSLEDCVRIALEKNDRLVSVEFGVRAAEERRREASAARKPSASIRGGASYAPVTGLDPALTEGGEYAALLDVEQKLYDGGALRLAGRRAEVGVEQAREERARTAAELRLEVRLAYVDLLDAQRRQAFTEESIHDLESYLGTVRALASGGAVPKTDVLKVEIQLQTEAGALDDLRTAVPSARRRLVAALGLPLDGEIAIQDTVSLPPLPPALQAAANPDLRQAELEIRATELDMQVARAERQPVLALQGSVGAWTSRTQLIDSDSPDVVGYLAGVSLEMPVWNWGATSARIEQQAAALNARRADERVLQRQLDAEYRDDLARYETARRKLSRLEENRRRAQEQYGLILSQYAGGGSSSLEVLDAHRSLFEVALQQQEARSEIDRLHAQLLRVAGEAP